MVEIWCESKTDLCRVTRSLKSIRLLCKNLDGFCGTSMIKYFKHLEDIALDREVERSSKEAPKTSQYFLCLDTINNLVMKCDVRPTI